MKSKLFKTISAVVLSTVIFGIVSAVFAGCDKKDDTAFYGTYKLSEKIYSTELDPSAELPDMSFVIYPDSFTVLTEFNTNQDYYDYKTNPSVIPSLDDDPSDIKYPFEFYQPVEYIETEADDPEINNGFLNYADKITDDKSALEKAYAISVDGKSVNDDLEAYQTIKNNPVTMKYVFYNIDGKYYFYVKTGMPMISGENMIFALEKVSDYEPTETEYAQNEFGGAYEAYDYLFTFDTVKTEIGYSEMESFARENIPKNRYFIYKDRYVKLFNHMQSFPQYPYPNMFDRYLNANDPEYTVTEISKLSQAELDSDIFLSEYGKKVKPISEIKQGLRLSISDKSGGQQIFSLYLIDGEYYTYDDYFAFKLQKTTN